MTWILSMHDYKQRQLPTVGYLKASSGRQDSDCLNRPHLAVVMQARRDRENFSHRDGESVLGVAPRVAGDAAPGLPAASIIERMSDWWSGLTEREAIAITVAIVACVFTAALIVVLA